MKTYLESVQLDTGENFSLSPTLVFSKLPKRKKAQQLLILAPNTELAGQIFEVTKTWGEAVGLTAQLFLSGSSQKRQIERLKKGPEILIGTPGRIFELVKLKKNQDDERGSHHSR